MLKIISKSFKKVEKKEIQFSERFVLILQPTYYSV